MISQESKTENKFSILCNQIYNSIRDKEGKDNYNFTKPSGSLKKLILQGFNIEQIWEQIALSDVNLLEIPEDIDNITEENFYFQASQFEILPEIDSKSFKLLKDIPLDKYSKSDESNIEKSFSSNHVPDSQESETSEKDDNDSDLEEESDEGLAESRDEDSDEEEESVEKNSLDDEENEESDEGVVESSDGDDKIDSDMDEEPSDRISEDGDKEVADDGENSENNSDADEEASDKNSSDSEDSAYDELDRQLYDKYIKDDDSEEDDLDDESDIEGLAVGSGESDSENDLGEAEEDENSDQEEANGSEEETQPRKKQKLKVKIDDTDTTFKKPNMPSFNKTSVDSQFLNLRESEWVADEDVIGKSNFDDIDLMEDIQSDEEGEDMKYDDFFDTPQTKSTTTQKKTKLQKGDVTSSVGFGENNFVEDSSDRNAIQAESMDSKASQQQQAEKSTFQKEIEHELHIRQHLESKNISEQPWKLKGEVRSGDRPMNSVLNEHLQFRSGVKIRPEINDALTNHLARLGKDRFKTKAFDSVERKSKLVVNPFEYKKALVLDQEKSSKSLSQIYEEEYKRKTRLEKAKEEEKELPEHKAIREGYEELEHLLNALSNAHYTPKEACADLKIVSNLPSIAIEEATPIAVAEADQLAPQEILAPLKGDLKSNEEKTKTDKKRERRSKKSFQHHKYKNINKKVDAKAKKASEDGIKIDKDTSSKIVSKAIKTGKVKMMDKGGDGGNLKSSNTFFKQLYETHSADTKKKVQKKRKRGE